MMRFLRIPLELLSFLVAVWMAWTAWISFRKAFCNGADWAAISAGTFFLLIACLFLVTSVRLGKSEARIRKHRKERNRKKRQEDDSPVDEMADCQKGEQQYD